MDLYEIVIWIVLGAVIGWLASLFMGTLKKTKGILTVVIGILGAFLGGWLWRQLGLPKFFTEAILNTLLSGFVGAVIVIVLLRGIGLLKKKK
jgi:uncharacterized membrane protein YeaQ/YmgE (transglycosylase-associated protein family)